MIGARVLVGRSVSQSGGDAIELRCVMLSILLSSERIACGYLKVQIRFSSELVYAKTLSHTLSTLYFGRFRTPCIRMHSHTSAHHHDAGTPGWYGLRKRMSIHQHTSNSLRATVMCGISKGMIMMANTVTKLPSAREHRRPPCHTLFILTHLHVQARLSVAWNMNASVQSGTGLTLGYVI